MNKLKALIAKEKSQYFAYLGLSGAVLGLTGALLFSDTPTFARFLGKANPLLTVLTLALLGFLLLSYLLNQGWFAIYKKERRRGLWYATALAALFAFLIIGIDLIAVFPKDINIPWPDSLLFYPAIAFIVEILFHVLPLTLLLFLFSLVSKRPADERAHRMAILLVALLEPVYQTVLGSSEAIPQWTIIYVAIHIFLINVSQLVLFKRFDFISMYAFRLVYYFLWHILWGYWRLELLF